MISLTLTIVDVIILLSFGLIAKIILNKKDDIMSHCKRRMGFILKSKKNKARTK